MYKLHVTYKYPKDIRHFLDYEQSKIFDHLIYGQDVSKLNFEEKVKLPSLVSVLAKKINPLGDHNNINYRDILIKILQKNHINFSHFLSDKELEELFLKYKFKTIIDNLSKEQKAEFEKQIKLIAEQEGLTSEQIKSLNTIGLLTAANLSGFGMYVMASTVVGGISGVLGVTLPFAFYTGMSSFLSFITGPVGWIFGLGYLAYNFRNDNMDSIVSKITNNFSVLKKQLTGDFEYVETVVIFIASHRLLLAKEAIQCFKEQIDIEYYNNRKGRKKNELTFIEKIEFETKWRKFTSVIENNYIEMLCSDDDLKKIEKEYPFYKTPYREILRRQFLKKGIIMPR